MTDNVNHPKHYNNLPAACECGRGIECIQVVQHMVFNLGNVVKYCWREDSKGGIEDLKKAMRYLEYELKKRTESAKKRVKRQSKKTVKRKVNR